VAAVASLALVASGCGAGGDGGKSGSVPGITKDTIKLGTTQPLTGPAAPGYAKISKSMAAYFKHVNAEGGINGRKIDLLIEDDGYNPTNTAAKTRQLVLKDKVFALVGALGTAPHTSVLDFIRQNKIPDLFVSSGSLSWNQPTKYPYTFGWQPDYTREGKILATYAKENFAGKTFCTFGQGDDLGADGVKGVEQVLGADALKAKESYTVSNTNVAPAIGKLQAAGCEVVFSFSIPGFTALAVGTAAKLGYKAQWMVSSVGADPVALSGYLKEAAKPLTEGILATNYLPAATDAENSWVKLFTEINDKYNGGAPMDATALYGYALAYTVAEALAAAGDNPTRASLVKAVEKGDFTGPGLTPFAYSAKDHSGYTGSEIVQIKNLVSESVSPVYVTDDGDGAVKEYDAAAAEAPANGVPK
jgi:ABC-type branched-subunit amino acid transport system substrate-binding protein